MFRLSGGAMTMCMGVYDYSMSVFYSGPMFQVVASIVGNVATAETKQRTTLTERTPGG